MYKYHPFYNRFKLILSDPLNLKINKIKDSGKYENNIITLYNGLKVYKDSYYGQFSDILIINEGVHEPSEEFLFIKILDDIKSSNPIMIELGSYWAFYSMSFLKKFPLGNTFCIESGDVEMECGIKNFELNNLKGEFKKGYVGTNHITLDNFIVEKNIDSIDILHCDIQGNELEMLIGAKNLLLNKKISYLFISTHSESLHKNCINYLNNLNYNIISEVNLYETFCEDGIIVASNPNITTEKIKLPKKSKTNIISDDILNNLFKTKII